MLTGVHRNEGEALILQCDGDLDDHCNSMKPRAREHSIRNTVSREVCCKCDVAYRSEDASHARKGQAEVRAAQQDHRG